MTGAQAKLIARLWGGYPNTIPVGDETASPTSLVCVRNKWLEPTGETGSFPNGEPFKCYRASAIGLRVLAGFLSKATGEDGR